MKKLMLSLLVIITFVLHVINQRSLKDESVIAKVPISAQASSLTPKPSPSAISPLPSAVSPTSPPASVVPSTSTFPAATPTNPPQASSQTYKDGQYNGDVTDAYYGNVQVKVVIQSSKITDVQFLDYPHDRSHSIEINTQATPILGQEAIQAQSSQVDIVSGATQTSKAFMQSLQSALNKAKA